MSAGVKLPVHGIIYLRFTRKGDCPAYSNAGNPLPTASVLKVHHYYGLRPRKTSLYNYFQHRDWTAYLGMGAESKGYAIAGEQCALTGPAQ